jgi:hypothetical protein
LFEICAASRQIRFGRRKEKLASKSLARRERFPIWVPPEVMKEAKALSVVEAESILSPWLPLVGRA